MSVEEAIANLWRPSPSHEEWVSRCDRLILEVQAAMPCYDPGEPHGITSDDGSMVYDIAIQDDCGRCTPCITRAELARRKVAV